MWPTGTQISGDGRYAILPDGTLGWNRLGEDDVRREIRRWDLGSERTAEGWRVAVCDRAGATLWASDPIARVECVGVARQRIAEIWPGSTLTEHRCGLNAYRRGYRPDCGMPHAEWHLGGALYVGTPGSAG